MDNETAATAPLWQYDERVKGVNNPVPLTPP